jgi:uncharacterized OsmC-like protein
MLLRESIILQRQAPLRVDYQQHPDRARITKHVRTAAIDGTDALHGIVIPGDSYDVSIRYGIDRAVGGYHDAPNPGELLCAALAACQDATLRMVADACGVELLDLEVEVRGHVDVRASLGMPVNSLLGFDSMDCIVHLQVAEDTPRKLLERLLATAERSCINLATLRHGVPVSVDFDLDIESTADRLPAADTGTQ